MLRVAGLQKVCEDVRQQIRYALSARIPGRPLVFAGFSDSNCVRLFSIKNQLPHDGHTNQPKSESAGKDDTSLNIEGSVALTQKLTSTVDLEPLRAHLREQGQPHNIRSFLFNEHQKQLKKDAAQSIKATSTSTPKNQGSKRLSTTYLGTRYEYLTQSHLASFNFELVVVGGRGDSGIDLLGTWTLPDPATSPPPNSAPAQRTFKVLVQCKRLSTNRTPTPSLIRELEGAISNTISSPSSLVPAVFREGHILGVLVCTRPATEGILKAMRGSRRGLVWICLAEDDVPEIAAIDATARVSEAETDKSIEPLSRDGDAVLKSVPGTRVKQMTWNAAASQVGLEGFNVGMRYNGEGGVKDAVLMLQGRPVNQSSMHEVQTRHGR